LQKKREREKEREKCKTFCKCTPVASTNCVSVVTPQTQYSFLGVFSERGCVFICAWEREKERGETKRERDREKRERQREERER